MRAALKNILLGRPADPGAERGLALLVTLLIVAFLIAVITELVFMVQSHTDMALNFKDQQRANLLSEGGVRLANSWLSENIIKEKNTAFGKNDDNMVLFEEAGSLSLKAEDEQGKISLNSIVFSNGIKNDIFYNIYLRFLEDQGLGEELAETLADWIDEDDDANIQGAETYDYYSTLTPPYKAKGAPLSSVEELLLVKGYTKETINKIAPFVTAHTDGKININTASREVLLALSEDMTDEMAKRIIELRVETPLEEISTIVSVTGFEEVGYELQNSITVKSTIFKIRSLARVGETISEVETIVDEDSRPRTLYWRER